MNKTTSLEASPTDGNLGAIKPTQPMETNPNVTIGTTFNSTIVNDRTLFSSHTINIVSLIHFQKKIYNKNNNNYENNQ